MANATTEAEGASPLREEIERLHHEVDSLVDRFKEGAGGLGAEAYEGLREHTSKARKSTQDAAQVVGHKIEESPFTSLLITFVVGLAARRAVRPPLVTSGIGSLHRLDAMGRYVQ